MAALPTTRDLNERAKGLVHQVATSIHEKHGFSSMAYSIYDTAWVSMVIKSNKEGCKWLFPESFNFLLDQQRTSGEWTSFKSSTSSTHMPPANVLIPDTIIHTLAALLALCFHARHRGLANEIFTQDISDRIRRAKDSVNSNLQEWKVTETTHFEFQLLIPVLLQRLIDEEGISFNFPGKKELWTMHNAAREMDIEWLYSEKCDVPLFSIEGFLGKLDFSRIAHQVSFEGIGASPASAAAYLIYAPVWNTQCESYLRHVIEHGTGKATGAVASIFPLTTFESSWVLTTLLENGFNTQELGKQSVETIIRFLDEQLRLNGGRVGATTTFAPDADDTGRALTALYHHGHSPSLASLITNHEVDAHFQTFFGRIPSLVPSISVNSNVLNALLSSPQPPQAQVIKCVKYLCNSWKSNEVPGDHWNLSKYYALLHMAFSLTKFCLSQDKGNISLSLEDRNLLNLVCLTLAKCKSHTLKDQNEDGSWGERHSCEESAYAILTLTSILKLDGNVQSRRNIRAAVERGKRYLTRWKGPDSSDRVWTGKVLHADLFIQEAYVLAALKAESLFSGPDNEICKL